MINKHWTEQKRSILTIDMISIDKQQNTVQANTTLPGLSFSLDLSVLELADNRPDTQILYDLLVIGAGPAGITAAIYARRKGLTTAIIGRTVGGQVKDTSIIKNYLGMESITGTELTTKFQNHLQACNVPLLRERTVTAIRREGEVFVLDLDDQSHFKSRTVLIATGAGPRQLGVPGEQEFRHKGVTYCAICDGPLFSGQDIIVVGGGNAAVESAIDLARFVRKITLVHRSVFRAEKILQHRLAQLDNVEIKLGYVVEEIKGDKKVTATVVRHLESNRLETLPTAGVVIEIGKNPASAPFRDLVDCNEWHEIVVDSNQATSVPGIFAAGDVTSVRQKQIIIAAGAGANAGLAINEYLNQYPSTRRNQYNKQEN
ncbi:MAG: NAD(P)/FAD-dependent oxidoreductase [Saccharofermentanales bacterium]|jgi:alkyl hydroperoxide reductase subunit F|nr:FAD-dependent oxidoreductase [Bacillota bacterium]NLB09399.1 FAD-dependent oxidoreductase [Clostridiales bacterium]